MSNKKLQLKSARGRAAAWLLVALFGVLAAPFVSPARAAAPSAEYLVKLATPDASVLSAIGDNITREFSFSSDPQFANIYSFSSSESLAQITAALGNTAEYVEPDGQMQSSTVLDNGDLVNGLPAQAVSVNDPGFTSNPLNIDKQWALPKAGFDYAWSKTTGSASNVVALIDTGVDATHEDLQSLNLVPGFNFITNQPIVGRVNSDDNGHGTLVAGILGATANNGTGIVGTNWAISVMPLKALDSQGKGDSASVAQAIVWAADHGANFINLSLGGIGFGHDTVLANAIDYAFKKNVLIVAAAGNDVAATGGNLDQQPVFPVCDDNGTNEVLGVAATDQNDLKASFSNFGQNCIDVSAPGKRILSTINHDPLTSSYAPNSYAYVSGTSVAAPFVVGEAALIRTLNPNATNTQIRDQILSTADPIDNLNLSQCDGQSCKGLLGTGRIDVQAALTAKVAAQTIADGDLISDGTSGPVYELISGQKRPVSQFVLQQRFSGQTPKMISSAQLSNYPTGPYVTPTDGTLVKTLNSPTVYIISHGQRQPVLYSVFLQRKLNFSQVITLDDAEMSSWLVGSLYPPTDGTLVRGQKDVTVYWVVGESLHPINYAFYQQRGLNVFPIMVLPDADVAGFAKGDAYIR